MIDRSSKIVISGQGLMGSCLAWVLYERDIDFILRDKETPKSSSLVAAGLINPITGANFNKSWKVECYLPKSRDFFRSLEKRLECVFWHELKIVRLFPQGEQKDKVLKKWEAGALKPYAKYLKSLNSECYRIKDGILLDQAARVDVKLFVELTKEYFAREGKFYNCPNVVDSKDVLVQAHGAAGLLNGDMEPLSHRCAKGEILTIKAPDLPQEYTIIDRGWLIPIGDSLFRVGATYEWNDLDSEPTEKGVKFVEQWMQKHIDCDWEIVDHQAGIRPIIRQSKPLIDRHENTWTVNGLGSKGALYAPQLAKVLADCILKGKTIPEDLDAKVFKKEQGL